MALTVFGALLMLLPVVAALSLEWVFTPAVFVELIRVEPAAALVSPLVSQFASVGIFGAAFDAVLLLIAGRYVERALGGAGVVAAFVGGAYAGALARLVLTPGSLVPGLGATGGLFAVIGAYLMLYGIPAALPIAQRGSRLAQIGMVALIWTGLQLVFLLVSGGADPSTAIVEPLGGLAAGVALARPLLAWRYRGA